MHYTWPHIIIIAIGYITYLFTMFCFIIYLMSCIVLAANYDETDLMSPSLSYRLQAILNNTGNYQGRFKFQEKYTKNQKTVSLIDISPSLTHAIKHVKLPSNMRVDPAYTFCSHGYCMATITKYMHPEILDQLNPTFNKPEGQGIINISDYKKKAIKKRYIKKKDVDKNHRFEDFKSLSDLP